MWQCTGRLRIKRRDFEKYVPFTDTELQYLLESRKKDLSRIWECFLAKNMQLIPYSSKGVSGQTETHRTATIRDLLQRCYAGCPEECGIVGARMCSEYGRSIATKLGKLLADKDVQVISGMALGIDSASTRGHCRERAVPLRCLGVVVMCVIRKMPGICMKIFRVPVEESCQNIRRGRNRCLTGFRSETGSSVPCQTVW